MNGIIAFHLCGWGRVPLVGGRSNFLSLPSLHPVNRSKAISPGFGSTDVNSRHQLAGHYINASRVVVIVIAPFPVAVTSDQSSTIIDWGSISHAIFLHRFPHHVSNNLEVETLVESLRLTHVMVKSIADVIISMDDSVVYIDDEQTLTDLNFDPGVIICA